VRSEGIIRSANDIDPVDWPWDNFTPHEIACKHCGQVYYWPGFMDRLQALRDEVGKPIRIKSAHRCRIHNARVGGAPLSQHLRIAVDVDLKGHNRTEFARKARKVGFTGFGFYQSFLHLDLGRLRHWFGGKRSKKSWE